MSNDQHRFQSVVQRLESRLGELLPPGSAQGSLVLTESLRRPTCTILFLRCEPDRYEFVAKVPHPGLVAPTAADDRPRCFPLLPSIARSRHEYRALQAIAKHFSNITDPRFGILRPLDHLPETGILVTERMHQGTLRQLLMRSHRFRRPTVPTHLYRAVRNAGAWLRTFHQQVVLESEARFHRKSDFLDMCERLCGYLGTRLRRQRLFRQLSQRIQELAGERLPAHLELGPCHGDFAPRNLFVDTTDRVTVCDALGIWRAPIYHDLAEWLVNVKASGLQTLSLQTAFSARVVQTCEREFLTGYYGSEPIPLAVLRLYETHALLAKWASAASRRGSLRRLLAGVQGWTYRGLIQAALRDVGDRNPLLEGPRR